MRVALFGGSFNPPHVGHQLAALYVLETTGVDALWMIPCFRHPFDKALAPFEARLAMCELAAAALGPRVQVSDIERTLGGTSRTLVTVQALQQAHPEHSFELVVGTDLQTEIDSWYGADRLRALVSFIVVGRQGNGAPGTVAMPNVSSTEIRARLSAGQPVTGLLPSRVLAYIRAHKLFGIADASAGGDADV